MTQMDVKSEVSINNIRPVSRIRRDKCRSSSKLKWNNVTSQPDRASTPSLRVQDYDPGYALRKIALLYEKNQNEEVARLISDLSSSTLNKIYSDFPIDMFIEGIPHTLGIINALYSRIFTERPTHFPLVTLPLGGLVMQIVKLYARSMSKDLPKVKSLEMQESQCKNLLKIAGYVDGVGVLNMLRHRKRCLDRALEGLGEHGMVEVETSHIGVEEVHSELMPLLSALFVELERMSTNCKITHNKLTRAAKSLTRQELDLSPSSTLKRANIFTFEPSKNERNHAAFDLPSECNHQHVLHYTTSNIQDRLYKNKATLNVVEPAMNYAQLPKLVSILQDRIERDKDLLLTFSQLRKEIITVPCDAKLAPALTHYSQAFQAVINVLKEYVPDDPGSPETLSINGFRSDSDSPFRARNQRKSVVMNGHADAASNDSSPLNNSDHSVGLQSHNTDVKASQQASTKAEANPTLQTKCDKLQHNLHRAQKSIERLKQREKELITRLSKQAQRSFDGGNGTFEDLSTGGARPSELARSYQNLYSDGRLQALDALDDAWRTEDDVKGKLLFSVMVLSFRSCSDTLEYIRHSLHEVMCASIVVTGDPKFEAATCEVKNTFNSYLRKTTKHYNLAPNIEDVFNQICTALYDRPGLSKSRALHNYVQECVRLSWALAVQSPPLFLEYDGSTFDSLKHERFHTSDNTSDLIVSYLWPSLLEKQSGKCVAKGVVITGV